jgi:hypothetical protein
MPSFAFPAGVFAFLLVPAFVERAALAFDALDPRFLREAAPVFLSLVAFAIAYFPPAFRSGPAIGSIASSKTGYPIAVQSKASSTSRRAADRNRRQRVHARELRQRTTVHQLLEQVRARRKLDDSRQRLSGQVSKSKRRGLLARAKQLVAAGRAKAKAKRRSELIHSQGQQRRRR